MLEGYVLDSFKGTRYFYFVTGPEIYFLFRQKIVKAS